MGSPQGQPSARTERSEGGQKPAVIEDRAQRVSDNYPAGPATVRRGPVAGARRDVSLDVRLSRAEKDAVAARASGLGVKPSRWARAVVLDALDVGRDEVAGLHRAAQYRPDPQAGAAVEQLRRVGVLVNQTQRTRATGLKQLGEVFRVLRDTRQLDDELLSKLLASVTALEDSKVAAQLAQVSAAIDELRSSLGDRTRL